MPVCKKCRNYVMSFPCPHCGSDESFFDRGPEEFRPIVPKDLQGTFDEPPAPKVSFNTSDWSSGDRQNVSTIRKNEISYTRSASPKMKVTSSPSQIYSKADSYSAPPLSIQVPDSEVSKRLNVVENGVQALNVEIKELRKELQSILKSQKVIETILTKLSKKI